jgi:drug/metabolite transporter (DMT)-like permease
MGLFFAPGLGLRLLVVSQPVMQIVRSVMLAASTFIFMSALAYVPLATAAAIGFTGPFIVTALAPLLLNERVGLVRWLFVILGFVGALIILRPGFAAVEPAAFLLLGSAFTSALYQILSRKLASHDRAETSITYMALAGFVLASVPLPLIWVTPKSGLDWALFVGLGVFGGFGHYFWQRALELGPAPFVSPFNYLGLIGAAILSMVVFHTIPDVWVWVGAGVIAGSGIFMLFYEHRQRARRPEPAENA